jgi:hypothetical protein
MRMYRCTVQVTAAIAVEAESLAEAGRIIDGVLEGTDEVIFSEDGGIENGGDELVGTRQNMSRSTIQAEH